MEISVQECRQDPNHGEAVLDVLLVSLRRVQGAVPPEPAVLPDFLPEKADLRLYPDWPDQISDFAVWLSHDFFGGHLSVLSSRETFRANEHESDNGQ